MTQKEIAAFWAKVDKSACWLWKAAKTDKGYGVFNYGHRTYKAHRVAYALAHGPIPPGACVLHRCDTPACVNPDHLFLGTRADNNADMLRKGRHVRGGTYTTGRYEHGVTHHNAKLTPAIVREIRRKRAAGVSFGVLAKSYGLSVGYVFRLINRKVWRDVD